MARKTPAARKSARVSSGKMPFANSPPEPDMFYSNGKEKLVSNKSVDMGSIAKGTDNSAPKGKGGRRK
jgi:hypothetical protein